MKFIAGKHYRTRSGDRARVYATDGCGRFPIHGAIETVEGWDATDWTADGTYDPGPASDGVDDLLDLWPGEEEDIPVAETLLDEPWVGQPVDLRGAALTPEMLRRFVEEQVYGSGRPPPLGWDQEHDSYHPLYPERRNRNQE